jgi:hypothetical protein
MRQEGAQTRRRSERLLEEIVTPAMEKQGVKVRSPLEFDFAGKPKREEIRRLVETADLCIADLTDRRFNVFFEYGLRRATGLPVLPMIYKRQRPGYDADDYDTATYDFGAERAEAARQRIEKFARDNRYFQPATLKAAPKRLDQTREIYEYIEENRPTRIDILQFSLLCLRDLFETLRRSPHTMVRLLLLHPERASEYGLGPEQGGDVRESQRMVKNLPEIARIHGGECPNVGLWYYRHEPSIAVVMIDQSLIQLGWYLRDPTAADPGKLRVQGHDQPGVIAGGEHARALLPKMQLHFQSVLRNAELIHLVGPRSGEFRLEWEALKQKGAREANA